MTRIASAVLICWVSQALAGVAPLPPNLSARIPVDTRPGDQSDPHVNGDTVAYTDGTLGSGSTIRHFNLSSGASGVIPSSSGDSDFLSDVSGQNIVFTRVDSSGASNIYVYSLSTLSMIGLDVRPLVGRERAAIGGNQVAFEDLVALGSGAEMVRADFTTGVLTQITSDGQINYAAALSPDGAVLAWVKCTVGFTTCDVYTEIAGTVVNASNREGEERTPDTNGQVVVYSAARLSSTTGRDIAWVPVSGGTEKRLPLAGEDLNPNISDNLVAFEHREVGSFASDLFVYDIRSERLFQLTDTPENEQLNDIYVKADGTVWVVYSVKESDQNVYAYSFTVAPECNATQDAGLDCDALWSTPADVEVTAVRGQGQPEVVSAVSSSTSVGPALLCIRTGSEGVSSGAVWLNGEEVIGPSDFNPHVHKLSRSVTATGSDQLSASVGLAGAPGSQFTAKFYGPSRFMCTQPGLSVPSLSDGTSGSTSTTSALSSTTDSSVVTTQTTTDSGAKGCSSAGGGVLGGFWLALWPLLRRRQTPEAL